MGESSRTGIDTSSLVEVIQRLTSPSKSKAIKEVSPMLRVTRKMFKSKRGMLRSKIKRSSIVEATRAWIEYQVRLKAQLLRYKASLYTVRAAT